MIRLNFIPPAIAETAGVANAKQAKTQVDCCGPVRMEERTYLIRDGTLHLPFMLRIGKCRCGQAFYDCLSMGIDEMPKAPVSPGRY